MGRENQGSTAGGFQASQVGFLLLWIGFSLFASQLLVHFFISLFIPENNIEAFREQGWLHFLTGILSHCLFLCGFIFLKENFTFLKNLLGFRYLTKKGLFLSSIGGLFFAFLFIILSNVFPPSNPLPMDLLIQTKWDYLVLCLLALGLAPLSEEILFRGVLYPFFEKRITRNGSILLISILFSALHIRQLGDYWLGISLIFVLGLIITTLRALTKSTSLCWSFHFFYNLTFAILSLGKVA